MKNSIKIIILIALIVFGITGCASFDRDVKSLKSDVNGGLNRVVKVYSYDGKLIATHEGKIDIKESAYGNKVLFDLNGKRYVYYNALVEVIEK